MIMIFNITNEYIIEFQYNKNHDSGPLTFYAIVMLNYQCMAVSMTFLTLIKLF